METMPAVRLTAPGTPLEMADLAVPRPGPGEVLVTVEVAGICRSDVHYRAGHPTTGRLPIILGHEIAGRIAEVGEGVGGDRVGERVALHYQLGCEACDWCRDDQRHFCRRGRMLGKDVDGGFARHVVVPTGNALPVPKEVDIATAAVTMCSTATVLHALRRARLETGETLAVFGAGGLGTSAIQVGLLLGAAAVYAVDINPEKLRRAVRLGAVAIEGGVGAPGAIGDATGGAGVDVAVDLVGDGVVLAQCLASLAPRGRAVVVGLIAGEVAIDPYRHLLVGERSLVGSSDHTAGEIAELLAWTAAGSIDPGRAITNHVPLTAAAINEVLDDMESFGDDVRTVVEV